jgi:hypothetical protein
MGSPGRKQSAIYREVLRAEQWFHLWRAHELVEEHTHHVFVEEPFAVFRECGGVPDRIIRAQAH